VHFVALWLTLQEGLIPSKGSSLASSAHSMRIPVGCRIRPVAYWDAINSTIMLMHWQTSGSQSCCCSGVFLHPCNNCCAWQRMRHAGGHHLAHRLHTHVRGGGRQVVLHMGQPVHVIVSTGQPLARVWDGAARVPGDQEWVVTAVFGCRGGTSHGTGLVLVAGWRA
jgi:hypothetical protein